MASPLRRYHHGAFRAELLARAKGDSLVSVCIPARNEERTIGAIVETIRAELVDGAHLVDEYPGGGRRFVRLDRPYRLGTGRRRRAGKPAH